MTVLARFAEKLGLALASGQADAIVVGDEEIPLTEQEQIDEIGVEVVEGVKEVLKDQGIFGGRPDYGDHVQRVTAQVNKAAGYRAGDCRTVEQAMARLTAVWDLRERVK